MKLRSFRRFTIYTISISLYILDGDRKAYYENSQWSIQMNKDSIQKLRTKNKELRLDLAKKKAVCNIPLCFSCLQITYIHILE